MFAEFERWVKVAAVYVDPIVIIFVLMIVLLFCAEALFILLSSNMAAANRVQAHVPWLEEGRVFGMLETDKIERHMIRRPEGVEGEDPTKHYEEYWKDEIAYAAWKVLMENEVMRNLLNAEEPPDKNKPFNPTFRFPALKALGPKKRVGNAGLSKEQAKKNN